ncbi:CdaR family protein [Streptococcus ictaluri]|uniref:YbbR-like protein n=1 Tax=Streptococcus ictaluri 707-05 TaxID=764299 RepID=G5K2I7_9STRE|nr:YbbR-like domain-containing protein [Streptococcus ictaluri]EHI69396.1 YbbR-like protein [Streptococcus ictaluri 707-05]
MKRFLNSRLWLGLVSVFFAILLFLTAASSNHKNSGSQIYSPIETYTHSLKDVPIEMKYDSHKYFISGYSYGAGVYLTSTNRIKLDSEVNSDTRSFKIVADLTKSKPGTAMVNLKVENLPSGVTATISPDKVSVTIGKKVTKEFPVRGRVDNKQIANGYDINKIETGIDKAEVTSDESTIALIDHVVAKLPDDEVLSANYSSRVTLQAVSADGTILASAIDPAKANLAVTVKKITKSFPIRVEAVGVMDDSLSDIQYKLSKQTAIISGSREVLDSIDEIVAEVNISDVTKNTSKTVSLSSSQVSIEPSVVTVQLTTTKK